MRYRYYTCFIIHGRKGWGIQSGGLILFIYISFWFIIFFSVLSFILLRKTVKFSHQIIMYEIFVFCYIGWEV